jgi:hypothetical protein
LNPENRLVVRVEIGLIDPMQKIRSVDFLYMTAKQAGDSLKSGTHLTDLGNCRKLPLKVENQVATGEFTLRPGVREVDMVCQGVYTTSDGKKNFAKNEPEKIRGATEGPNAGAPMMAGPPFPFPGRSFSFSSSTTESFSSSVTSSPPRAGSGRSIDDSGPETRILGGHGNRRFTDSSSGLLVGFEVGLGKWGSNDVVHTIRPIFRHSDEREEMGEQHGQDSTRSFVVKAKKGYAVGGLTVKSMALVDGFSITFMKVNANGGLDKSKRYESKWVGGKGGGQETRIGGDGRPVIGIVGFEDEQNCTAFGLVRKR